MRTGQWKVANAVVFVATLAANAAAGTGAMSGESIGVIANRFPSLFLPANYVFGIWTLIYAWQFVFVVFQALPLAVSSRTVTRLGPWWAVSNVLNAVWLATFAFSRFALAMVIMLALLAVLIVIAERLRGAPAMGWAEMVCVRWSFDLYLAWISVAVIANTFQLAHVVGFEGAGMTEATWALTMMGVATALGWILALMRGMWVFPLVVAWALRGIGARYADVAPIAAAAGALVPAGIVVGALLSAAARRFAPPATPETGAG